MKRHTKSYIGQRIKIKKCEISDGIYSGLSHGKIFKIIKPPGITANSEKGVWIRHNNEFVYLIRKEYIIIPLKKETTLNQ